MERLIWIEWIGIWGSGKSTTIRNLIKDSDIVITGEGRLDSQTEKGKVVSGVFSLAKKYNKPLIVVCGDEEEGISDKLGLKKVYTVLDRTNSIDEAIENAEKYLTEIGADILSNL